MAFGVLMVLVKIMSIAYASVFGNPRVDVDAADFLMETHFRNACRMVYYRSRSCLRVASKTDPTLIFVQPAIVSPPEDTQASLQKDLQTLPQPSPKDIGFLDPSLQHDFPELYLFHDAHTFCDHIKRS